LTALYSVQIKLFPIIRQAVANAIEEAKAAAGCICGTNDNDGVANWIEERVLGLKTK